MEWIILIVSVIAVIIFLNILITNIAKKNGYYDIYKSISDYEIGFISTIVMLFFVVFCTIIVVSAGLFSNKVLTIAYFAIIAILGGTTNSFIKLLVAKSKKAKGEFVNTSITGVEKDRIHKKQRREDLTLTALLILLFSGKNKKK